MSQTSSIHRTTSEIPAFIDRIVRPLTRILNPFILRVAGGWWFPMFSLLEHRGHRTGRMYVTPVTAMPRAGWFWLGLTFGRDSGWARNVLAAGECTIRYRGTDYHLVEPAVIDGPSVGSRLPRLMRFAMALVGVREVLRMRPVSV
jgi:deazaflavin-dependent oxidoreductase (nitroreductase family)